MDPIMQRQMDRLNQMTQWHANEHTMGTAMPMPGPYGPGGANVWSPANAHYGIQVPPTPNYNPASAYVAPTHPPSFPVHHGHYQHHGYHHQQQQQQQQPSAARPSAFESFGNEYAHSISNHMNTPSRSRLAAVPSSRDRSHGSIGYAYVPTSNRAQPESIPRSAPDTYADSPTPSPAYSPLSSPSPNDSPLPSSGLGYQSNIVLDPAVDQSELLERGRSTQALARALTLLTTWRESKKQLEAEMTARIQFEKVVKDVKLYGYRDGDRAFMNNNMSRLPNLLSSDLTKLLSDTSFDLQSTRNSDVEFGKFAVEASQICLLWEVFLLDRVFVWEEGYTIQRYQSNHPTFVIAIKHKGCHDTTVGICHWREVMEGVGDHLYQIADMKSLGKVSALFNNVLGRINVIIARLPIDDKITFATRQETTILLSNVGRQLAAKIRQWNVRGTYGYSRDDDAPHPPQPPRRFIEDDHHRFDSDTDKSKGKGKQRESSNRDSGGSSSSSGGRSHAPSHRHQTANEIRERNEMSVDERREELEEGKRIRMMSQLQSDTEIALNKSMLELRTSHQFKSVPTGQIY